MDVPVNNILKFIPNHLKIIKIVLHLLPKHLVEQNNSLNMKIVKLKK